MWNPYVPHVEGTGLGATLRGLLMSPHPLPAWVSDRFVTDPRAARAYQEINKVYATLTTFTDPLFRSMADGLQGLERAPRTRPTIRPAAASVVSRSVLMTTS